VVTEYKYGGARAMVELHERHLRSFVETWKRATKQNAKLPKTDDKDYESMELLLRHVLGAARMYMVWMCDKLELPDPGIEPAPEVGRIEDRVAEHMNHLLEKWRSPLKEVAEELFYDPAHKSRWDVDYCIDAMLEHAVMHPIRHEYQLKKLLGEE
jgi:hypothetical protein